MIEIYNENCFDTMNDMSIGCVDVILTSPFYNTNKKAGKNTTLENIKIKEGAYTHVRYDVHIDGMTDEEYAEYTERLFNEFDRILNMNGCVIYNLSYGAENTECMFKAINRVITETNFTIADVITWKKPTAIPNNCSRNKLTRITEFVFVFCRKNEVKTFNCNKRVVSVRKTGQKSYENIYNYVEAKNNDGSCPYNKATYSTELCEKLLKIYAVGGSRVYDPFIGTGTTAIACNRMGFDCIGSEISSNQVKFAKERYIKEFGEEGIYCEIKE